MRMALSLPGASNRQTNAAGGANFARYFTCWKDSRTAVHISQALSHAGIGVLRFDFAEPGFNYGIHGIGRPKCKWRSDR